MAPEVTEQRRRELLRLLERRRRRVRLLLVCLVTAATCGVVAGVVGPQLLIGGIASEADSPCLAKATHAARPPKPVAGPLELVDRLDLDPREAQANAIRWANMTEPERRKLLARYWRLAEKDSAELDRLVDRYEAFRDLPAKRQEFLRTRAQKLKEFMKTLGPQDQAVLESMGPDQRAERLLQLWQARYGTWDGAKEVAKSE